MQLTNWQEAKEKELFVSCVQAKHYQGNFNMLSAIIILLSLLIFTLTPGFGHAFTLSNNIPQKYYLDNDGDGKGGTTVRDIYVDGLDLPPVLHQFSNTYVLDNGDCDDNNEYPFCPDGKCGDLKNPCDNVDGDKTICQIEWDKMVQKSIEAYKRKKEERINPSPQNNPKDSINSTSPECLNDGIDTAKNQQSPISFQNKN